MSTVDLKSLSAADLAEMQAAIVAEAKERAAEAAKHASEDDDSMRAAIREGLDMIPEGSRQGRFVVFSVSVKEDGTIHIGRPGAKGGPTGGGRGRPRNGSGITSNGTPIPDGFSTQAAWIRSLLEEGKSIADVGRTIGNHGHAYNVAKSMGLV